MGVVPAARAGETAGTGSRGATPASEPRAVLRVALVGNPNTGKSTVFNALTGLRQRVANFPGVTVECTEGSYVHDGQPVEVVDLPGAYSLVPESPDEAIARDALLGQARGVAPVDVVVLVVDAENLERNLFYASQVLELGLPTVVALNRMDRVEAAGTRIDVPELIHELGATVIPVVARRGEGIDHLRRAIAQALALPRPSHLLPPAATHEQEAEVRYGWVAQTVARTVTHVARTGSSTSDRVDAVVLHRVWGPIVFLAVMALVFQAMFTWAQPLMDGIESLVAGLGSAVGSVLPAGPLCGLVVDGMIAGVGSVIVFLPQITILFTLIGLLEDTGYMARAAFLMDRYMRPFGLRGKSFIPLVSGFACAVPAIMATRTIKEPRERLATIMVVPLISCSARLPVYTLLIAAFVPAVAVWGGLGLQALTLLAMYLLGTVAALAVAAVFRRTILKSAPRALILELPPYAMPRPRVLFASVWQRVRLFLRRAGTVIFAVSIVLWGMANYPAHPDAGATADQRLAYSALGRAGKAIEPAVRPLGYDWKIGVSIVTSFAAREVFVTTMSTIHGVEEAGDGAEQSLVDRLRAAKNEAGLPAYTPLVAVGLMVFYVFALMCTSTIAVTVRECGGGRIGAAWALLQFAYMLALAYGAGYAVYRIGLALGLGGA
jgi:ferrous iron transport protein B